MGRLRIKNIFSFLIWGGTVVSLTVACGEQQAIGGAQSSSSANQVDEVLINDLDQTATESFSVDSPNAFRASSFVHTGSGNSLNEQADLFEFTSDEYGPILTTRSTATNIHSHFEKGANLADFTYSGKMMFSNEKSGIGITFLSQYPNQDAYYRLRRYGSNKKFHLAGHKALACDGQTFGSDAKANTYYHFEVKTYIDDEATSITVSILEEGKPLAETEVLECVDRSTDRLQAGTIGVWSMGQGEKSWADLRISYNLLGRAPASPQQPTVPVPAPEEPSEPAPQPEPTPEPQPEPPPVVETPTPVLPPSIPVNPNYPSAATTGIANCSNKSLTKVGTIKTKSDGQIIENVHVTGSIQVQHKNVIIRCSKVDANNSRYGISCGLGSTSSCYNLTVEDTEVWDASSAGILAFKKAIMKRVNVHHSIDGIKMGSNTVLEDSYVHSLKKNDPVCDAHSDSVQIRNGSNMIIRGNRLDSTFATDDKCSPGKDANMFLVQAKGGDISNVTIENNLFSGGNYVMALTKEGHNFTNLFVRNNRWVANAWRYGAVYLKNMGDWGGQNKCWENNMILHTNGSTTPARAPSNAKKCSEL